MMLKRWGLNVMAILIGGLVGIVTVTYASQKMALPPLPAILIILFFAALFYAISHIAGPKLFPGPTVNELVHADLPRRPWAWLKPAGIAPRSPFPLNKDQMILGREVRCDVMIANDSISRRHAEIVRMAEGWLVRDLGSRNGTFVNGQRIQEYVLQEGDLITIGDVNLTFEAPRTPVRAAGPEPVATLAIRPGDMVAPDTAVWKGEGNTEVWRPRKG